MEVHHGEMLFRFFSYHLSRLKGKAPTWIMKKEVSSVHILQQKQIQSSCMVQVASHFVLDAASTLNLQNSAETG